MRLLSLILLLYPSFSPAEPSSREEALTLLAEGQIQEAITLLKTLPPKAEHLCLLGRACFLAKRYVEAVETWTQLPKEAPCWNSARFGRADALRALGRSEEAAQIYEELGAKRLDPVRPSAWLDWLLEIAEQLAREDRGAAEGLLMRTLETLQRQPEEFNLPLQRRLALKIAQLREPGAPHHLLAKILAHEGELQGSLRRLIANLLSPAWALSFLKQASGVEERLIHSQKLLKLNPEGGLLKLPEGLNLAQLKPALEFLKRKRRFGELLKLLAALPESLEVSRERALRLQEAGRWVKAEEALKRHLKRHPSDPQRRLLERYRDEANWMQLRLDYTASRWTQVLKSAEAFVSPRIAPLAIFAAEAVGRLKEAQQYRAEALARWPEDSTLKALHLRRLLQEEGAKALSSEEQAALSEPSLYLASEGYFSKSTAAKLRVITRNIKHLEVRLHRIDAEAFLRDGGTLAGLAALDIAVIEPDKRWNIEVPKYSALKEIDFNLPLPLLKPGFYRITLSGAEKEASVPLWISDIKLLARAEGGELLAVVFRGGQPVPAAPILIHSSKGVQVEESDARGLLRVKVPSGDLSLLSEVEGAPALLSLPGERHEAPEAPKVRLSLETDRSFYAPGDLVHFRLSARQGGAPLQGEFKICLEGARCVTLKSGPLGTAQGQLPIPHTPNAKYRELSIEVQAPGEEKLQKLKVVVISSKFLRYRLRGSLEGSGARLSLIDAEGLPIPGALIHWRDDLSQGRGVSDALGQLWVQGPPLGIPWSLGASSKGALHIRLRRVLPPSSELSLESDQQRLRPGEKIRLRLKGAAGPLHLKLFKLEAPQHLQQLQDPQAPQRELGTYVNDQFHTPQRPLHGPVHLLREERIEPFQGDLELSRSLPRPGFYRWLLVSEEEPTQPVGLHCQVDEEIRLLGLRDLGLGETLSFKLEAPHPALVLASAQGQVVKAALLSPGESLNWPISPNWHGPLVLSALDPSGGLFEQTIMVDARIKLKLEAETEGGNWSLEVQATDALGAPVEAELSIFSLEEEKQLHLESAPKLSRGWGLQSQGISLDLRSGAEGQPLDPALMAEGARLEERARASGVASGALGGRWSKMQRTPIVLEELRIEGLGYGSGKRALLGSRRAKLPRVMAGKASIQGVLSPGPLDPGIWAVLKTDKAGQASLKFPRPSVQRPIKLRVHAVSLETVGEAELKLSPAQSLRLLPPKLSPGFPGEVLTPQVRLFNGNSQPFRGELFFGDLGQHVELAPGALLSLPMNPIRPGDSGMLRLMRGGALLESQLWSFPIAEGCADPQGEILNLMLPERGSFPGAALALREHPKLWKDQKLMGQAGRAALAALPSAGAQERGALLRRLWAVHDALQGEGALSASAFLFLAEARSLFKLSGPDLEKAAERLPTPSQEDRLLQLRGRARAGLPINEALLSYALQAPESRGEAALVLLSLGREAETEKLKLGEDLSSKLAAYLMGRPVEMPSPLPPSPAHPSLADWIRLQTAPGDLNSPRTIFDGTKEIAKLQPGESLSLLLPPESELRAEGVWSYRSSPPETGQAPLSIKRYPKGLSAPLRESCQGERARCNAKRCLLAVGDILEIRATPIEESWRPPAGFELISMRNSRLKLRALYPGRSPLRGLKTAEGTALLRLLEVQAQLPLRENFCQTQALSLAQQALKLGRSPLPWLAPWPKEEGWGSQFPEVLQLRFHQALNEGTTPQLLIQSFERLRALWPTAMLNQGEIIAVARAYRATAQPERAVDLWRAGLEASFRDETASLLKLEQRVGRLASLKGIKELSAVYPALPAVEEALFLLPQRLAEMSKDELPETLKEADLSSTDLKMMAAAWQREFLGAWPQSQKRPAAAFHMIQLLLDLGAEGQAARWAQRLAAQSPQSPLLDALLYQEGLARSRLREDKAAFKIFKQLVEGEFPQSDGHLGPAQSRRDAQLAAAQLHEARGELGEASAAYRAGGHTQRGRSLEQVLLESPAQLWFKSAEPSLLSIRVANLKEIHLRAYRLDLKTLFLRDHGLDRLHKIDVDGLRPVWSGSREVEIGAFPESRTLKLPLTKPGAYLIRLSAKGQSSSSLLIRSDLGLDLRLEGEQLRIWVQRQGKPVAAAQVRAAQKGEAIRATQTDLRGVALLEVGSTVLVIDGEHVAFHKGQLSSLQELADPFEEESEESNSNIEMRLREQVLDNNLLLEEGYLNNVGIEAISF